MIYTWRNPYDAVVSCKRAFGASIEHWIEVLRASLRLWSYHLATGSACIVPYEEIVKEPVAGIRRIAQYLDTPLIPGQIDQIAEEVSFERMKGFSRHIAELKPGRLIQGPGYVYDRETLLHQNHIRHGGIGYGRHSLTEPQLHALDSVLEDEGFGFVREKHGQESILGRSVPLATT